MPEKLWTYFCKHWRATMVETSVAALHTVSSKVTLPIHGHSTMSWSLNQVMVTKSNHCHSTKSWLFNQVMVTLPNLGHSPQSWSLGHVMVILPPLHIYSTIQSSFLHTIPVFAIRFIISQLVSTDNAHAI